MGMTTATVEDAPAAPAESKRLRSSVRAWALGIILPALAGVAFVLGKSMLLSPHIEHVHAWIYSRDLFIPLPAAKYVAHGAVFQMYEPTAGAAGIGYPYTPALPIVLSPVGWIADRFALLDNLKYPVARPSLFPLFGTIVAVLGIIPLMVSVGNALRPHLRATRVLAAQWAVALSTGVVTVMYMHPEDAIACAGLIASAHAAATGRARRAGVMLLIAILFKQWAVIPAVVIIAAVSQRERRVTAFYAFAVPVLVMIPFVAAAPHATISALTGAEASLHIGHRQIWTSALFGSSTYGSATPLRLLWLGIALGVAWYVRNRPDLTVLLGAIGLVMLARLVCEPTIFAYYLGPVAAFAILCAALRGQPIALRTICAITMQCWCAFHDLPEGLWWLVLAVGMAYVCAPLFAAIRSERPETTVPRAFAVPSVA
jgi:hypothetical protein